MHFSVYYYPQFVRDDFREVIAIKQNEKRNKIKTLGKEFTCITCLKLQLLTCQVRLLMQLPNYGVLKHEFFYMFLLFFY